MPRDTRRGFTLIELLVVVAIIALLISILLPSLQQAKEQAKKAKCLANMKGIATSVHAYATEDKSEHAIPIFQLMRADGQNGRPRRNGLGGPNANLYMTLWSYRTADWFAWGGRSAPDLFMISNTTGIDCGDDGPYAARHRPLNRYIYNGGLDAARDSSGRDLKTGPAYDMPLYQCPSDSGYPDHALIDDAPRANAERPMYDTVGSSYRGSLFGYHGRERAYGLGPWGHRMSTLLDPGRLILMGEPTFFNMIGQDNGNSNPDPVVVTGWHRKRMVDNLIFADGSARPTTATGHEDIDVAVARMMGIAAANAGLVSRGPSWRFDLYPTPGAYIRGPANLDWIGGVNLTSWPFANFQNNMR